MLLFGTEDAGNVLKKLAAVFVVVVLTAVFAVPSVSAEDVKVTLVEVQGNRRIETATILAKIKTREGQVFSPAQIREDIKTLYQLGHFEDVQVKTEGFENGIKVIFYVKEKPLIREISFAGNEAIDTEDLKKEITLLPRTAYNVQLIEENAEKIRLKYQDKGYFNAVVVPVVTELRGGDRNVVFFIEEGEKIKLYKIIFTGNKALSSSEIKKALKTQEHWFFSFLGRSGTLRTQELRDDVETIKNLYYNIGYIQVQVDEPIIEKMTPTRYTFQLMGQTETYANKHENELVVRINIKEGDQFRVSSISFKGNKLLSDEDLKKEMKLKPGDIFSRDTLRQDVGRIMDRYDGLSRPFASVVPLFAIDAEKKTVALSMEIEEGDQVRIGRIDITGNVKTRDKVIRREMRLDEGDLYSKKALKRSYERLNNLNFFESIDIVPERRQREPIMDLDVKVKEKLTGTLSVGGGYSSVDHLIGIAEITQGNLGGRGQLLKFKTQLGSRSRLFLLSFMEPYLFDKPIWGRVDIYNQTQKYDGYDLNTNGFALGVGKSYGEYVSASLRYSFDRSDVTNLSTTPPFIIQKQIEDYGKTITTSAVTASLIRDSRDYFLDPKTGSRNSVLFEYAGGPLGGDPEFIKSVADSSWFFPLFWDTVFMVRGRFGYATSLIDKPLPVGERFFVGGTGTVRGFKYGSAGPKEPIYGPVYTVKNPFGNPQLTGEQIVDFNNIGGTKELIFNAEYSFPIVPAARLKGVLFYDIGKAFDDHEPVEFSSLKQSFGWGFWWLTPIGPLRFEWGYIIHKKPEDQPSQFDFSIGTQF